MELNNPNQPGPDPSELNGDPNLLREMIRQQAQPIMEEEVAALKGAALGENNFERATWRHGYRARAWKTRAGKVELPIPTYPESRHAKICSTNPIERLNQEIKRRSRTVEVFH